MIPRDVKAPTIAIPFHKLLKVVAIVDDKDAQTKQLLDHIPAENFEVEVGEQLRPGRLRGCRGRRLHRVGRWRAAGARAQTWRARFAPSASARRCGRWRIRTASPTWPCSASPARSTATSTSASRRPPSTPSRSSRAS